MDPKTVAKRFREAGGVVDFPSKPKVPTTLIHGRKYLLSDYWPLGSSLEGMGSPEGAGGGARLIDLGGNRFRYLWIYDTDRGRLAMYRASDGNNKLDDRASSLTHYIYTLEKKGQLNRVTRQEFDQVDREMRNREDENLKALQKHLDEIATDWDKEVKKILEDWFERKIQPVIVRRLAELESGVIPFGFKVNEGILAHRSAEEQAKMFVIGQTLKSFTQAEAYKIVSEAVGYDAYEPPHGGDSQAVQWAWSDLVGEVYERFEVV